MLNAGVAVAVGAVCARLISRCSRALTGQKQIQARWKRCVNLTDRELGEALGQRYVDVTFGPDGKQRMLKMVDALEKSLDGQTFRIFPG